MKDDRKRQSVKADYVNALGLTAYCFASCEWQVVWCCEKIRPGSLNRIVGEEMTAGKIAKQFIDLTRNLPKSREREKLKAAAAVFAELVQVRNAIFHGKPCTGPSGEPRLYSGKVWEIPDLEDAADAFVACSQELNRLSQEFLASYTAP